MVLKIRNALATCDERLRLEQVVRGALSMRSGEYEAVITHGVDVLHAEVVILEHGEWVAAYFADLRRPEEELSTGLARVLSAGD